MYNAAWGCFSFVVRWVSVGTGSWQGFGLCVDLCDPAMCLYAWVSVRTKEKQRSGGVGLGVRVFAVEVRGFLVDNFLPPYWLQSCF